MSQIRCFTESVGSSVQFVRYSSSFETKLLALIDSLMSEVPKLQRLVDTRSIPQVIEQLKQERKSQVIAIAQARLAKSKDTTLLAGWQHPYDVDDFSPSLHPIGALMEAVAKAATGMTHPIPDDTIDGRSWYQSRRFLVQIPEEKIIIDQADMEGYPKYLIDNSKTPPAVAATLGGRKDEALEYMKNMIRRALADETLRVAGRILPCTIEIATTRHSEGTPSRSVREREEEAAKAIRETISRRVAMRMEALNWSGEPLVTVVSGPKA